MNDIPQDDGPKVAKLFADIDARTGHREVLPEAMDVRAPVRVPDGYNEEALAVNGDPAPAEEEVAPAGHALIQHVGQRMHQAGEAAIAILSNMAEAEFAMGNPRNMPEPLLGWYAMTLAFQLCVLEFTARSLEERTAHAGQLGAALAALGARTAYASGVQEEIKALLAERVPTVQKLCGDADPSYDGVLAWS